MVQEKQQKNINQILQQYSSSIIYSLWMKKDHNLPYDIQHLILIFTGCANMQLMMRKTKPTNCQCKFFTEFYLMEYIDSYHGMHEVYYRRWLCSYNVSHIFAKYY